MENMENITIEEIVSKWGDINLTIFGTHNFGVDYIAYIEEYLDNSMIIIVTIWDDLYEKPEHITTSITISDMLSTLKSPKISYIKSDNTLVIKSGNRYE